MFLKDFLYICLSWPKKPAVWAAPPREAGWIYIYIYTWTLNCYGNKSYGSKVSWSQDFPYNPPISWRFHNKFTIGSPIKPSITHHHPSTDHSAHTLTGSSTTWSKSMQHIFSGLVLRSQELVASKQGQTASRIVFDKGTTLYPLSFGGNSTHEFCDTTGIFCR